MSDKMSAILEGLNPEQQKAVRSVEGPVLIVAGAGSGKTRVLTSRVAYILAGGEDPSRVLALTFTKKAASEMKERVALLVGRRQARQIVMGTFHSVFVRFLRDYAESVGYPKTFTIYDRSDSESAVKASVKELGYDEKIYKPRDVLARISFAKNGLFTPGAYARNQEFREHDIHSKKPHTAEVYALYQKKLQQSGVMDFDDLLLNMNILLRDNAEARAEIAGRFDYIMVDEYQDTNYSQYLILKKLSERHHNLCVVGDDSQSIYAFRGAQIQNILNFQKDYPESKIIRLERNYRSTRNIVDAANSVIAHNEGRIPKTCYSDGEAGEKIEFLKAFTEQEEAVMIVSEIQRRTMKDKAQYQDFAILYRTNSQSRALEEALRRRNMPYMVYSGNSFFDRTEIKDMMAWFKLCVNVNDDESLKRIINKPARGIGDTSVSKLNELARAHGCTLFQAAWQQDYSAYGLRDADISRIRAFCGIVNELAAKTPSADGHDLALEIAEKSGLYASFKADTSIEGMARLANLDELLNSVQVFEEERLDDILEDMADADNAEAPVITLADFLESTSLLSNADTSEGDDVNNKVALMTVHSAKGLEFPYVFIAGAEENLFPSGGMLASPAEIEEERRLFYVALTRAKKAVYVSFCTTRMRNGKHESNSPSRFVREIDARYIANPLSDDDGGADEGAGGSGGFGPSGFRFGSRAYGGKHSSGSPWSPSDYGRSGQVQSFRRSPQASSSGAFRSTSTAPAKPSPMQSRIVKPTAAPALIDPDFVAVPMTELYVNERVEHNRFGGGTILSITGTAPEMKAEIDFDAYGKKLLLLKYAKLRPEKK